ncbi:hypothetical protein OESDEN_20376 [Oesophagostomum dentatum]|uniref:Uncharacterized protein n=1 Tax=Oesophagostomum dentatum TaxID=61180 RepID=A0A0B1S8U5_OESDE|nr:hypothetical protein OESDEN_20376 [Oesophagostomum dentatum]
MTRKFDNFLIDCIARSRENSSRIKYITLKSTVRLVAQDCSEESERSTMSFNKKNP